MPKPLFALACFVFAIGSLSPSLAAPAPPIQGKDLITASEVRLDPSNGTGPTVVVFVSARCPCSMSHEATLKGLSTEFQEARFVAIHSNTDETALESAAHFAPLHLPFPIIQDEGAKIATQFGALKTPHVFVYNKSGNIVYQGGMDDSHDASQAKQHPLKDALLALREGKSPPMDRTRTLGCIIRR